MSGLNPTLFSGVFDAINPSNPMGDTYAEAILDDLEGEQESFPDIVVEDSEDNDLSKLLDTVKHASKGVSEGTHKEYMRSVALASP